MNSLVARIQFSNVYRRLAAFVVVAAVAIMSLVMAPSAHATIGICDTAGPVEVEATIVGPGPTAYATLGRDRRDQRRLAHRRDRRRSVREHDRDGSHRS